MKCSICGKSGNFISWRVGLDILYCNECSEEEKTTESYLRGYNLGSLETYRKAVTFGKRSMDKWVLMAFAFGMLFMVVAYQVAYLHLTSGR